MAMAFFGGKGLEDEWWAGRRGGGCEADRPQHGRKGLFWGRGARRVRVNNTFEKFICTKYLRKKLIATNIIYQQNKDIICGNLSVLGPFSLLHIHTVNTYCTHILYINIHLYTNK
jgi:hypothetical protein